MLQVSRQSRPNGVFRVRDILKNKMNPGETLPIDIQPRDIEVLRGLFESRVMTLSHLSAIYFDNKAEAAKKRIQKLKKAGLVAERPRRVREPSVLFLTRKGFSLLTDGGHVTDYPRITAANLDKRAQVSALTLRHELEVMDVKAAFCAAIATKPHLCIAEFSTWPILYEFRAFKPNGESVTVKPDGFIRIHETEADGGVSEHTFFLEVDRSTETQSVLTAKASCYIDFYRRGGLAVRNGRSPEEFKDFPFRVLMVFKTTERRDNTAKALLALNPPILTQVWLATMSEVVDNPLKAAWVQPRDCRRTPFHIRQASNLIGE